MAESSGFFDAYSSINEEGEIIYDRVYLAESFAKYFASFIANGVFGGKSNELMVNQKSVADMSIRVLSGQAWINGYWYENDDELSLSIDVADGVLNRIDLIVVRWDNVERVIRLAVKKGVAATNPSAPIIQRDADFYELKLAEVYVKAGTTKITQVDITDTRLQEDVCGYVVGVVQQLDTEEFGAQLGAYVEQFIAEYNALKEKTYKDIGDWKAQTESSYNVWFNQFKTSSDSKIENFLTQNQTSVDTLLNNSQTEIDNLIAQIEGILSESDVESLNAKITAVVQRVVTLESSTQTLTSDVSTLKSDVSGLKKLFVHSGPNAGCYYRVSSTGENEWINPPNDIGIEYRTTERWNTKPVYQKLIYVGALANKTTVLVTIGAEFSKIISISGFAIDWDDNTSYPFPIIISGLTPAAVISSIQDAGAGNSSIVIQTNENLSHLVGYIQVKYVKE